MQEKWTFKFDEENIENLLSKEARDLGIFLSYYFKKEGAVAEKVSLKGQVEFQTKVSGNLVLEFDLVHFNACLAIHEQKRDQIKVNFLIDEINREMTLIGPFWPERDGDEI
jgi:hypothetical protein